eukprot:7229094-Pyramimonas_sp.AAC.1
MAQISALVSRESSAAIKVVQSHPTRLTREAPKTSSVPDATSTSAMSTSSALRMHIRRHAAGGNAGPHGTHCSR